MGNHTPRSRVAAPAKKHTPRPVLTAPDGRTVAPPPGTKPRRPPRKRQFNADPDAVTCAAVVRGSLISAFDAAFCGGGLGVALWQGEATVQTRRLLAGLRECATEREGLTLLRAEGLAAFQAAMLAVFPEEFGTGDEERPGVCPPAGPRRVGTDRLRRFVGADAGLMALARKMGGR